MEGLLWLAPENEDDRGTIDAATAKLRMDNPAYLQAENMGVVLKGIPRYLDFWQTDGEWTGIPRAFFPKTHHLWVPKPKEATPTEPFGCLWRARPFQPPAVDAVCYALDHHPWGGVLDAPCGTGKTVMALEVIRRKAVPTVVVVHKEFLMSQWEERIREFLPGAKVGRIQGDRCDSGKDFDIVLAMVQSLTRRAYPPSILESFDLVVADEVHRMGAPEWHVAVAKFPAKMRLGLTATVNRKDGLTAVFLAHIGQVIYSVPMDAARVHTELYTLRSPAIVPPGRYLQSWNRKPNISRLVNELCADSDRTGLICGNVARASQAGRKVLVLTLRLEHVNQIVGALALKGFDVSRFVGGMKQTEQDEAARSDIIVGTFQMAKEGLDIPELDTLVIAAPTSDVEQAVGRIQRQHPGKKQPLVIDVLDEKVPICVGMFRARSRTYTKLKVQAQ